MRRLGIAVVALVHTACAVGDVGPGAGTSESAGAGGSDGADGAEGLGGTPAALLGAVPSTLACNHLDLEIFLVRCARGYAYLRTWTPLGTDPACAVYYTLGAEQFESQQAALDSRSCDGACLLAPWMCFTVLRCEEMTGYIVYTDPDAPRCASLVETPDGVFASVDEWNDQFPCPR